MREFREYDSHPVERTVIQLAKSADYMVSSMGLDAAISKVDEFIMMKIGSG